MTPPRDFVRADKNLSGMRKYDINSDEDDTDPPQDLNQNYRTQEKPKKRKDKSIGGNYESNQDPSKKLSEQWNKLVHEYKPPKELMSVNSRPILAGN